MLSTFTDHPAIYLDKYLEHRMCVRTYFEYKLRISGKPVNILQAEAHGAHQLAAP